MGSMRTCEYPTAAGRCERSRGHGTYHAVGREADHRDHEEREALIALIVAAEDVDGCHANDSSKYARVLQLRRMTTLGISRQARLAAKGKHPYPEARR